LLTLVVSFCDISHLTFFRCITLLYFAIRLESRKSANKRIYLSISLSIYLSIYLGEYGYIRFHQIYGLGDKLEAKLTAMSEIVVNVCRTGATLTAWRRG